MGIIYTHGNHRLSSGHRRRAASPPARNHRQHNEEARMTRHLLHSSEYGRESHLMRFRDGAPKPGAGWTLRARGNSGGKHDPEHAEALPARDPNDWRYNTSGLSSASDAISGADCRRILRPVANPALAPWAGPASAQQQPQHEP